LIVLILKHIHLTKRTTARSIAQTGYKIHYIAARLLIPSAVQVFPVITVRPSGLIRADLLVNPSVRNDALSQTRHIHFILINPAQYEKLRRFDGDLTPEPLSLKQRIQQKLKELFLCQTC